MSWKGRLETKLVPRQRAHSETDSLSLEDAISPDSPKAPFFNLKPKWYIREMKQNQIYLLLFLMALGYAACKRYDDGPIVSFKSTEARLSETWVPETAKINGEDGITAVDGVNYVGITNDQMPWLKEITFLDGSECLSFMYRGSASLSYPGQWTFADNDTKINLRQSLSTNWADRVDQDWTILRLSSNKLNVTYIYNGTLYEVNFVPKK